MAATSHRVKVQLTNARLSFADIYRAKRFGGRGGDEGQGEPGYNCNFLLDPDTHWGRINIQRMEDAIDEVIKNTKWDGKEPKFRDDKLPLRYGDDVDYDGYEGMRYVSAGSKKKPRVLDFGKEDVGEGEDGAPYSGCIVDGIVQVWAQDNKYGKRINASLEGVRFKADGEPFGARSIDADDFSDEGDDDAGGGRSSSRSRNSRDRDDDDRGSRRGERDRSSDRSSRDDEDNDRRGRDRESDERRDRGERGGNRRDGDSDRRSGNRDRDEDRGERRRSSSEDEDAQDRRGSSGDDRRGSGRSSDDRGRDNDRRGRDRDRDREEDRDERRGGGRNDRDRDDYGEERSSRGRRNIV